MTGEIVPGIGVLRDFDEISARVAGVAPFVGSVHIDFADKTLVPGETFLGSDKFQPLTARFPDLSFEAHLMVGDPAKYIRPLAGVGFKRLIAHVESTDPRRFLEEGRYESVEIGLAIDGPTELELIEPFLDGIDFVLVMTIEAGASGMPFLPEGVEKVRAIRTHMPDLPIEVDGGITPDTIRLVKEAGATRFVSTHFVFKDMKRIGEAVEQLRSVL